MIAGHICCILGVVCLWPDAEHESIKSENPSGALSARPSRQTETARRLVRDRCDLGGSISPTNRERKRILTAEEWQILELSVRVGLLCVMVSLPPGVLLGWLLARGDFRGKLLLDSLLHLPLVLPPVVTGYVLLILFGRRGYFGILLQDWFDFHLAFTWKAAVLASAVVGFPLMLRSIRLAIEGVDIRLESAARTLGAGPLRAFGTITLKLATPGVLAGALLTFARSLGEFGATITFASNIAGETRTLPLAIYTFLNQPGGEAPATRLVIISALLSLVALASSELIARRVRKN